MVEKAHLVLRTVGHVDQALKEPPFSNRSTHGTENQAVVANLHILFGSQLNLIALYLYFPCGHGIFILSLRILGSAHLQE